MIFAHQDDDFIWMLPWWEKCEKFIGGAMPATPTFDTVIHFQQNFLNNHSYNIDYESNWLHPWEDITQTEYSSYYWSGNPSYNYLANDHLIAFWDDGSQIITRNEINRIKAKLETYIASTGVQRIITHNNWGEYGHQHHRAVNTAVRELAVKYKKDVWMLGCDIDENMIFNDISIPAGMTYTTGTFNTTLFNGLANCYQNGAYYVWTWPNHQSPSGSHPFIKVVDAGVDKSQLLSSGYSVTTTGPDQDRSGAYIFNGADDYMTLPGNNYPDFTISMFVRPDEIKSMDISSMKEYPSDATCNRSFFVNSGGTVEAKINDGSAKSVVSTSSLSSGVWSHIAMTAGAGSLKIYFNGVLQNSTSIGTLSGFTTPEFVLGLAQNTSSYFKGQISDVRLYNYTLNDAEIQSLSGGSPPVTYIITAISGLDGTISPAGTILVNAGSTREYSITANQYFEIANVKVDGISQGAISSYTFNNISANHSIRATYSPSLSVALNKPVTANASAGGCDPEKGNDVDGTNGSYWAVEANQGWWKVDLQHEYDLTFIVLRNYVDNSRYYHYEIWASNDDNNYTKIAQKTNNNPATDPGDYYYLAVTARYLRVNMTHSSTGNVHMCDFRAYGTPNTCTWTGNLNTDWNNASNWASGLKPASTTNVIIQAGTYHPVITEAVTCKNLTINASAQLEIAYTGRLIVTGTLANNAGITGLVLKSLSTGTASLVHSTPGVNATVERYFDNSGTQTGQSWDWHLLSSPVTSQPIWPAYVPTPENLSWAPITNWDFYYFNPNAPNNFWVNIKNTDGSYNSDAFDTENDYAGFGGSNPPSMISGRGYLVAYDDEGLKSFTGTLNTGEVKINVANKISLFNLIGNPYPSSIDWKAASGWSRNNLEGGNNSCNYWVYNEDWGNYGVFNSAGSDGSGTCGVTRYIAAGQAFFVKAANTSQSARDLIIMNDNVKVADAQLWLKSVVQNSNYLKLRLTSDKNNFADELVVEFNPDFNGSEGCEKIPSIQSQAPEISTVKNDIGYSIDHYSDISSPREISLNVKCAVTGNYTIYAFNLDRFTLFNKIFLEDLKTGNKINLKENVLYTFKGSPDDNTHRFKLLLGEPTGLKEDDTLHSVTIFTRNRDICINDPKANIGVSAVDIYDSLGRLVFSKKINLSSDKITTLNVPGVYIVKLQTNNNSKVAKIIIP